MKKYVVALLILALPIVTFSQQHVPEVEDYERFLKSKTMVVLDDALMSFYNSRIQEVVERAWTITPYEFISSREFEEKKNDPNLSFLLTTIVTFDRDKTRARYNFLSLLMGQPNADVKTMPDLCSLPLSYLDVEEDSYLYKLEAFVLFMQSHVRNALEDSRFIGDRGFRRYNRERGSLEGKKLLLTKEDLAADISTRAAIAENYPYDFEIVTRDEIEAAIARQDPDVVFLHKVGPEGTRIRARVYKLLVGAADSKLYYWNYQMIKHRSDDAFQRRDLRRLR
ncbi:hypothetical protein [Natronoflexus pectinivorans]|uniref:Uncharacterized protein n=1 Tax=Natronoflexus pectinivorans TaxID=682526 RepID=A0A4R2G8A3_9BACT|nr:hypothetical protein [Natronoflexus pectinivorans]TCO04057.1 hypothetical protein EV194_11947 [Natronoflexus pectinivorans]